MDIHHVLTEYDSLFCVTKPGEIDRFLDEKIREAAAEPDESALLTLLNEQIGFCRDTGQEEKALELIRRTKMLCQKMGVIGTAAYGSTLMNMASAFREFGHYEEAAACYPEIEEIYRNSLPAGAIDFAGLYNNWSLLLTKQGDVNGSIRMLERALEITDGIPEAVIPQATSRVNIALALAQNDRKGARQYLEESIVRFESAGGDDCHYSAALSAMGDLLLSDGHAAAAAENYEKAMTIMKAALRSESRGKVPICWAMTTGSPGTMITGLDSVCGLRRRTMKRSGNPCRENTGRCSIHPPLPGLT